MQEELITYGKNNPDIVPNLEVWGFPISLYLFLGGLAAGILFFTSASYLIKGDRQLPMVYRKAAWIAISALIIGTIALLFDLHRVVNSWRLYTHFDLEAPMSWGAWTLLFIIPLAVVWGVPYPVRFLRKSKLKIILENFAERIRKPVAFILLTMAVILGLYTGMLLNVFVARPLWNSTLLPILFLISGMSTGIAVILWLSKDIADQNRFRKVDIALIVTEIILILAYLAELFSGSIAQVSAIRELTAGQFAFLFWVLVILVGLVIPVFFELRELKGAEIPAYAAPALILIGGLAFRIIIVEAGQLLGM